MCKKFYNHVIWKVQISLVAQKQQYNNIQDIQYVANRKVRVTLFESHSLSAFDSLIYSHITLIKVSTGCSQMKKPRHQYTQVMVLFLGDYGKPRSSFYCLKRLHRASNEVCGYNFCFKLFCALPVSLYDIFTALCSSISLAMHQ